MSEETDQKRRQYIDEARVYADQHDRWCSPCVWWVCDFSKSPIEQRHVLALYDALTAAEKEALTNLEQALNWAARATTAEKERDDIQARFEEQLENKAKYAGALAGERIMRDAAEREVERLLEALELPRKRNTR